MNRIYYIKEEGKPRLPYVGSFSYGRLNAAKNYVEDHMPGFIVCSSGHLVSNYGGEGCYLIECVNWDTQVGARLWVYTPY